MTESERAEFDDADLALMVNGAGDYILHSPTREQWLEQLYDIIEENEAGRKSDDETCDEIAVMLEETPLRLDAMTASIRA